MVLSKFGSAFFHSIKILFIAVISCLANLSCLFSIYLSFILSRVLTNVSKNDSPIKDAASRGKNSLFSIGVNITFLIDFIYILKIFICALMDIDLLFIAIAFPIIPNCAFAFVIIIIGSLFSFRICPKYFAYCVVGTISSVLILVIVSSILFVINSHFFVFISIFSLDISSLITLNTS